MADSVAPKERFPTKMFFKIFSFVLIERVNKAGLHAAKFSRDYQKRI
jgi:hypothetical protein